MSDLVKLEKWLSGLDFEFWGTVQHKVSPAEFVPRMKSEGAVMLDLRADPELEYITFPFALHIPVHELVERWQEVPSDRLVGLFCSSGYRAGVALTYLQAQGLTNVRILEGGYGALVAEFGPPKILKLSK
jgi:rhodanese-related sulfurtransferase